MKKNVLLILASFLLLAPSLCAQTTTTPPPIPEEARRHFVMGTALFKDAKTHNDYVEVESEFKQAADLAPQWPDPRYNLALSKEAAGDFSGAIADLKIYLQFKLPDTEARTAQDKIYTLEARQRKVTEEANSPAAQLEKLIKSLDGGVWQCVQDLGGNYAGHTYIAITGNKVSNYYLYVPTVGNGHVVQGQMKDVPYDPSAKPAWTTTISGRTFTVTLGDFVGEHAPWLSSINEEITITDDSQSITEKSTQHTTDGHVYTNTLNYARIK
jgi:hypothetical protein